MGPACNLARRDDPQALLSRLTKIQRTWKHVATGRARAAAGRPHGLAKRVIACLDVRANDAGDLVVTKGDQYDVRESAGGNEVGWRLVRVC